MSIYVLKGLTPWLIQRISAVLIAVFLLYVAACVFLGSFGSFEQWLRWLYAPQNTIAVGVFSIAVLFHAWIGVRDILIDYVHPVVLRIFLFILVGSTLIGCGIWVFKILLLGH